jgi:enoyl-CoA hydratase/carnithine racemase
LPFVNLGLSPEAASSFLLPQLMGYQRAAELLLLGKPFSAQNACAYGLVNRVLPDGEVFDAALQTCRELAALPPSALRDTKRLIKQSQAAAVAETMRLEGQTFLKRLRSPEAQEAFAAFFERRPPDFSRFE